jgi:tRNA(fMet)-specific endonuclease VapC
MKYMLDTNICIELIRYKSPGMLKKLVSHLPGEVCISSITLAELAHGIEKSTQRDKNLLALQQFILPLELADFGQEAAIIYGKIRAELEKSGHMIGSMDMLIGAHALNLDAILVTNNTREFNRIKDLKLEDWLSEVKK